MDKVLEKIYKYLDGDLSQSEMVAFEKEMQSDPSLTKLYRSQENVHIALSQIPADTAPEHLADNVMSIIAQKKFSVEKYNSFSGLKIIAIGAVASLALSVALIVVFSNQAITSYSADPLAAYYKPLSEYLTPPTAMYSYSIYVCILLVIPLLMLLDGYAQKYISKKMV